MGGGERAQAAVGRDGRRWDDIGSGRKRWEAVGLHRQPLDEVRGGGMT